MRLSTACGTQVAGGYLDPQKLVLVVVLVVLRVRLLSEFEA
jgi:hypothetical protein